MENKEEQKKVEIIVSPSKETIVMRIDEELVSFIREDVVRERIDSAVKLAEPLLKQGKQPKDTIKTIRDLLASEVEYQNEKYI